MYMYFLFIIHIQLITFVQASCSSKTMPGERASVCTNTPKNVSASWYCFYTRIKGGISSLDSRVLPFFFIEHNYI